MGINTSVLKGITDILMDIIMNVDTSIIYENKFDIRKINNKPVDVYIFLTPDIEGYNPNIPEDNFVLNLSLNDKVHLCQIYDKDVIYEYRNDKFIILELDENDSFQEAGVNVSLPLNDDTRFQISTIFNVNEDILNESDHRIERFNLHLDYHNFNKHCEEILHILQTKREEMILSGENSDD